MSTETITLTLTVPLAEELASLNQDLLVEILERGLRQFKIDRALERYKQGNISFAAVANQAGITTSELARYAYGRGIEPLFSEATLQEELS